MRKKESRQSYERRLSNGRDEANTHLLFAVVGHYINFLASDHPKVAADKYLFTKSFLVIIIKALFQADSNLDFHLTNTFPVNLVFDHVLPLHFLFFFLMQNNLMVFIHAVSNCTIFLSHPKDIGKADAADAYP